MKYLCLSLMLAACSLSLTSCNTVAGFGDDVKHAGSALEKSAEKHGADR